MCQGSCSGNGLQNLHHTLPENTRHISKMKYRQEVQKMQSTTIHQFHDCYLPKSVSRGKKELRETVADDSEDSSSPVPRRSPRKLAAKVKTTVNPPASDDGTSSGDDAASVDVSVAASWRQAPKTQKGKFLVTLEEEQRLAYWYRDNPLFYDKTLRDHKDRDKKQRLLEEMVATLQAPQTAAQLKTWMESMRTAYGKLRKGPQPGSAKKALTYKDKWILDNFNFLAPHIRAVGASRAGNVSKNLETDVLL